MLGNLWHNISCEEAIKILGSDITKGLNEKDIKSRQVQRGRNFLPGEKPLSWLAIFFRQFKNPLIFILVIAGIITFLLRERVDSAVIISAVFLNALVGFLQEHKASRALEKLRMMAKQTAEVLRDGRFGVIDSTELVPGDIIILETGDKVPADGRIIESRDLKINEMVLSGEWLSTGKIAGILPQETPLADRDNMVYMGCVVEGGKAKVLVTEIGSKTEIGKIATIVRETKEEETPYQKRLADFSKVVGIVIVVIALGIFIEGMATGRRFAEMFTTSVAVAVASIPEGLPVAMTVVLALGMQRILKKKGLVRKLTAAETLGAVSIIASDKTATLTEGRMEVVDVVGDKLLSLKAALLISEAFIENPNDLEKNWKIHGRPTDKAFLQAGLEAGFGFGTDFWDQKIAEILFNPVSKFSAALYREDEGHMVYACGAPEIILEKCRLSDEEKNNIERQIRELAGKGFRLVAAAYKDISLEKVPVDTDRTRELERLCQDLDLGGLILLQDPIRKEVKEAIRICREAGMKPIMITGDHRLTAKAVATELGFDVSEENILEGKDLDKISGEDFDKILPQVQIYARVEPRQKMKIVEAWQKKGRVVAMTGDGINDAPALKRADIGVTLGSGTEVAKETSDLILLNDSFSIIVAAVEEGRAILDNIRKIITYLLSDSFTEVILVGASIVAGFPLPITAAQILWVNLIEDGPLSLALAFEPKEKDLMKQKPQRHNAPLLTKEMKTLIFIIGLATDFLLLGLLFWLLKYSGYEIDHIRSIIFAGLAVDSMFYVFSCKSLRQNLWRVNPFSNRFLIFSWLFGVLMLLSALYVPFLQDFLKTVPLDVFDWQLILGLGFLNVTLIEFTKWCFNRKRNV